jgi:MtN3 and saliva related transmembrane protein
MTLSYCLEQFFGIVASVTTVIGLMPQIYKAYKTRSMGDVSTMMLVVYLICSVSWLVYGLLTHATYVAVSNIICVFTSVISLHQKRKYGQCDDAYQKHDDIEKGSKA